MFVCPTMKTQWCVVFSEHFGIRQQAAGSSRHQAAGSSSRQQATGSMQQAAGSRINLMWTHDIVSNVSKPGVLRQSFKFWSGARFQRRNRYCTDLVSNLSKPGMLRQRFKFWSGARFQKRNRYCTDLVSNLAKPGILCQGFKMCTRASFFRTRNPFCADFGFKFVRA